MSSATILLLGKESIVREKLYDYVISSNWIIKFIIICISIS
jgi:hypothetical protein